MKREGIVLNANYLNFFVYSVILSLLVVVIVFLIQKFYFNESKDSTLINKYLNKPKSNKDVSVFAIIISVVIVIALNAFIYFYL